MTNASLAVIGVPSSAGGRRTGQEGAPAAFRAAGLLEELRALGFDVADLGDLPPVSFRPDPEHPRQQNVDLVLDVGRQVADRVDRALASARMPIVLGGDCSLGLGVIAGVLRHQSDVGLLYFDADLDLNTPETTPSGILDGMVLAHVLGRGVPELAGIGPRRPLLGEEEVVVFGFDAESASIDPPELAALESSRMAQYPLSRIRADATGAAERALRNLEDRCKAMVVHFDVDVTDLPAVDVPHPQGLDPDTAFDALSTFLAAPICTALVVTEFNAELDPDHSHVARLVRGLARAFAGRERLSS
jgi:arginase